MIASRRLFAVYAALLALSLLFTLYEELYLRKWLYRHLGHGSIVAGSLPNFLAVVVLSLAMLVFRFPRDLRASAQSILSIVIGLILYEIAQIWMPHRVFDWNDIGATLIGGLFSWLLILVPRQIFKESTGGASQ